jgi:hypothetical protein
VGLVSYPYETSINLDNVAPTLDVYEENIGVNEYLSMQKIEIYNL